MANDKSTFTQELGYIIDQFDELQDLRWSDLQYLDEYRELKMKKNDGLPVDQNRLNILEETFKNKIITSARWNKFQNALLGMQTFIKTEVNNYIDTEIEKFQYRGTYNPSIQYFQRNMVDYNDGAGVQTYLCIANSIGNLPTNPLYFKKLTVKGERGEQGLAGIGLKFRGLWNENATYNADDGVQYGGILYASLIDGNIGNQPNPSLNTEYWVKALDVTVTVKKMIGTRNIATQTSNVNFIAGEIISFNLGIDSLEVYQNSVRLTKGIDYTINPNNQSIDKISGVWEASIEQPIFFEFVVTKNILNNLVFSDGSAIENGTVAKSKLTTDVQEELDKIGILQGSGEAKEKANKSDLLALQTKVDEYKADTTTYSTYKLNPDSNGIFTELQYKRKNGTLIMKSVLSGGTSPKYTTRTETEYEQDGVTIKATRIYTITYTNDKVTSEVLQ